MIGQARRRRRRAPPPGPARGPRAERPRRPTTIGAIEGQARRRLARRPTPREAVGLPPLPRVAVPVGQGSPLRGRDLDRAARRRGLRRRGPRGGRPEGRPDGDLDPPPRAADLGRRRVAQRRRRHLARGPRRPAAGGRRRLDPVRLEDRRPARSVLVAGHRAQGPAAGPPPGRGDRPLGVPRPGCDAADPPVLGVVALVVPPAPLLGVGRVIGGAVLRPLARDRPGLIDLGRAGPRGKRPRVRRGRRGRAARPAGRIASRCRGAPPPAARPGGRRLRPGAPGVRRLSPRADASRTGAGPRTRRPGRRGCGTSGSGVASGCRGGRGPRGPGSGNGSERGRRWWVRVDVAGEGEPTRRDLGRYGNRPGSSKFP